MSWFKRLVGGAKGEPQRADPPKEVPKEEPKPNLAAVLAKHKELTVARAAALMELFGGPAKAMFPYHELQIAEDDPVMIDVFVFELRSEQYGDLEVAVTNGMSDRRMVDPEDPTYWGRHELIQYLPRCTREHAKRLYSMAWAPHEEGFYLDYYHTVDWKLASGPETPWTSAFFLRPLRRSHQEFEMIVEGDPTTLLWHVPITEKERLFKIEHGANALLDRMDEVDLPWVFEESNRPLMVE